VCESPSLPSTSNYFGQVAEESRKQPADPLGALVPEAVPGDRSGGPGLLSGARLVVKDVIDVAGAVTGAGNPDWAGAHGRATADARAVEALTGAGAELIAKGRCAELAFSLSGDNAHYGMPVNPAAPGRDPGGSTSGPAAAVAGGLCELGLGTDTLGSIRVPASYCGLYGYRPTHGAVDPTGALPLAQRFDTIGLLAADPALLARAARALLGGRASHEAPPRRLVLATDALDAAEPEVAAATRQAAERLAGRLEASLESRPALDGDAPELGAALKAFSVLQGAQVWRNFGRWVETARPSLGDDVGSRIERASRLTAADVARAEPVAAAVAEHIRALGAAEALVVPAAGTVAPPRDASSEERQAARIAAGRISCLASLAGAPSVSLPLTEVGGLPVGVALIGAPGADASLLAAAVDCLAPAG
jgi:amidase